MFANPDALLQAARCAFSETKLLKLIPQLFPSAQPSAIPGSACSGCRSGAGARSTQDCRGQRQTAATPAHRLRLSLHKVRLSRPLRHLPLSDAGVKPARTCKPCALRTGNAQKLPFVLKTGPFCGQTGQNLPFIHKTPHFCGQTCSNPAKM